MGQMMGILMNSVEMAKGLVSSIKKLEMILIFVSFGSMKLVFFKSKTRVDTESEFILVQSFFKMTEYHQNVNFSKGFHPLKYRFPGNQGIDFEELI